MCEYNLLIVVEVEAGLFDLLLSSTLMHCDQSGFLMHSATEQSMGEHAVGKKALAHKKSVHAG